MVLSNPVCLCSSNKKSYWGVFTANNNFHLRRDNFPSLTSRCSKVNLRDSKHLTKGYNPRQAARRPFFFSKDFFFLMMCTCGYGYVHECTCPWEPEEGIRSPGAEATDSCMSHTMWVLRTELRSSARAACGLKILSYHSSPPSSKVVINVPQVQKNLRPKHETSLYYTFHTCSPPARPLKTKRLRTNRCYSLSSHWSPKELGSHVLSYPLAGEYRGLPYFAVCKAQVYRTSRVISWLLFPWFRFKIMTFSEVCLCVCMLVPVRE